MQAKYLLAQRLAVGLLVAPLSGGGCEGCGCIEARPRWVVTFDPRLQHGRLIEDLALCIANLQDITKNFSSRFEQARLQQTTPRAGCATAKKGLNVDSMQVLRKDGSGLFSRPVPPDFGDLLMRAEDAHRRLSTVYKTGSTLKEQGEARLQIDQAAVDAREALRRAQSQYVIVVVIEEETLGYVYVEAGATGDKDEARKTDEQMNAAVVWEGSPTNTAEAKPEIAKELEQTIDGLLGKEDLPGGGLRMPGARYYKRGQCKGNAYLYSIADKDFICAAAFRAENRTDLVLQITETHYREYESRDIDSEGVAHTTSTEVPFKVKRAMTDQEVWNRLSDDLNWQMRKEVLHIW